MKTNSLGCRLALIAAACCLTACNPVSNLGSKFVKSERVTAANGAEILVAAGDSTALAGATLRVPAGALSADTTLTLELGETSLMGTARKGAGAVAVWGPAGTKFAKPVEMTLPYVLPAGETSANLFIQVKEEDGTLFVIDRSLITLDETKKLATFTIQGFTSFQPGTGQTCGSNGLCKSGEACVNGQCKPTGCQNATGFQCECTANADCKLGELCANGICQACANANAQGTCTGQCTDDKECPQGNLCISGKCGSCNATGTKCEQTCAKDSDCLNGQVCQAGVCAACTTANCKPTCGDKGQACCGAGYFAACNGGDLSCNAAGICDVCQPGTANCLNKCDPVSGVSCAPGQVCLNGACQACTNATCTVQCTSDASCGSGEVCVSGKCQACTATTCPPPPCGAADQVCCNTAGTTSPTCQSGLNCIGGACRSFCGGIASFQCPKPTQICVDDPTDNCDPNAGGSDCGGYCK